MQICDICKTNGVRYKHYTTINEKGTGKELELCGACYAKIYRKERDYAYLAYKETVEEMTGETSKKKSWLDRFKK